MIVSVNGREKKIAIVDNGRVTEFYIERGEENSGVVGNIYKGRVQRVLPGMQSAFVEIGLERDAFLYVSDFFDEEEEIERIVMEKSKKVSPEEAKREADDKIERARIDREKQMEAVQEIAEPFAAAPPADAPEIDFDKEKKGRRRGRKERAEGRSAPPEEPAEITGPADSHGVAPEEITFDMDDSSFERVIDDDDTGEMFKDAYRQEAIVDKVRAVEFDMEPTTAAEVGSLIDTVDQAGAAFERIADEDEGSAAETSAKTKGRKKAIKSKTADAAPKEEKPKRAARKTATKEKPASTRSRSKKTKAENVVEAEPNQASNETAAPETEPTPTAMAMPDGEASVRETGDISEMAVRRGGRGRRRGGRGRRPEHGDENSDTAETSETETEEVDTVIEAAPVEAEKNAEESPRETREPREAREPREPRESREPRGRGRDRDSRDTRGERGDRDRSGQNGKGRSSHDRSDRGDRRDRAPQPTITDLLREGQEVLVQIAKEPIAKKGARITSHIALPGRFLVYMPTIEHLGVSRKIESANERGRLRTLIQRIRQDEEIPSGGFIVRTAGVGISEEDLRQDARYLVRTWLDIKKASEKKKAPALVHQDLDIVQRILRDQLSDDFAAIRVDSEEEYLRVVEFINRIQPRMVNRVKLYTRDEPILETYGVQEEIDKALKPRVWLKSGGYLVINQTEALVAIDVNTGKFVGKGNARLEDTITKTNMEAVDEIARQIRLRDLGGIIVLDLIDMEDRRNRHKVSQALQEALQHDKSPTKVLSFNDFGLIIMTRKRVKQSLERTMCAPCEYCEGAGWVKSPTTVCYEILAEARRLSKNVEDLRQTTLRVHPDVSRALRESERAVLEEIEAYLGSVDVTADPAIHQAQYDFAFV